MKEIKDLTILVVDDEPDLGELVAFEFELVGASVFSASNGKEALEIVKTNAIDVVVSDIRMPGGDGVELLENLRTLDPVHPALVFMTGFADITLEDAYAKGAVAMFGKPFNRNELIDTVGKSVLGYEEKWASDLSGSEGTFTFNIDGNDLQSALDSGQIKFGKGGLFLHVPEKLPAVSDHVHFTLNFPGEPFKKLEGEGLVRWVRRQSDGAHLKGIGLEIKGIVGDNRSDILAFFKDLSSVAYIPK